MLTYNVQNYNPNRAFHFNLNQVLITQLNINNYISRPRANALR